MPGKSYHRTMYIAPSSGREVLNLNLPFKLILRRYEVVFWTPLHKTIVSLQLMVSLQTMVSAIDFLILIGYGAVLRAMVVTIVCRDTINCKDTIVLCNARLLTPAQMSEVRMLHFLKD